MGDFHRESHCFVQVYALCINTSYDLTVCPAGRGALDSSAPSRSLIEAKLLRIAQVALEQVNVLSRIGPLIFVARLPVLALPF